MATASDYFDKYGDPALNGLLVGVALVCLAVAFFPNSPRLAKAAVLAWLLIP